MPEDKNIFSNEYVSETETKAPDNKDRLKDKIDNDKYEILRPKRIIIKGRIDNDKG
ncbi:MAG: hypothetical protein ACM3WV_05960 [Bacillota bacterium]